MNSNTAGSEPQKVRLRILSSLVPLPSMPSPLDLKKVRTLTYVLPIGRYCRPLVGTLTTIRGSGSARKTAWKISRSQTSNLAVTALLQRVYHLKRHIGTSTSKRSPASRRSIVSSTWEYGRSQWMYCIVSRGMRLQRARLTFTPTAIYVTLQEWKRYKQPFLVGDWKVELRMRAGLSFMEWEVTRSGAK